MSLGLKDQQYIKYIKQGHKTSKIMKTVEESPQKWYNPDELNIQWNESLR